MQNDLSEQFIDDWNALAIELGLDSAKSLEIGQYLLAQYSGEDRHYHSVRHIVSMLDGLKKIEAKFENPAAAKLATFFHDVIYDVTRGDNEAQSAIKMKEMLNGLIDEKTLETAAFSIEATKKHVKTENNDTNLVIDLDMAILGQPWAVYERYAAGVMEEYTAGGGEEAKTKYRAGRPALFLKPTIDHGGIFITPEFQHLEAPAISNMQREIKILTSGKSFGGQGIT
jgi:predicted metal-dependent HD superfamily phosphohydrolase